MIPLLLLVLGAPPEANDALPPHAIIRLGVLRFRSDDRVREVAASRDGARVAVPAHSTVIIWDTASGREACRCGPAPATVLAAAFSPDGRTVAAATWNGQDDQNSPVILYDVASGRESGRVAGHRGGSEWVAFTSKGTLLTAGKDHLFRLWDLETAAEVRRFPRPGRYYPKPETVSHDGRYLACVDREDVQPVPLQVYEIATGRELFKAVVPTMVWSVAFAPDGKSLACCGSTVYRYEFPSGREVGRWKLPQDQVGGVLACSNDGPYLLTAPDDVLIAYDLAAGKPAGFPLRLPVCVANRAAAPTDLFVSGRGSRLEVWDLTIGRPRHPTAGHTDPVTGVFLSADGHAVTADGQSVRRWDASGHEQRAWRCPSTYAIAASALAPDGRTFANGDRAGVIRFWDPTSGRQTASVTESRDVTCALAFAPDGRTLAYPGSRTLRLWDTVASRTMWDAPVNGRRCSAFAFTPDRRTLLAGNEVGAIGAWEVASGKALRQLEGHPEFMEQPRQGGIRRIVPRPGHMGQVVSLAVSPDGRRLVSGGWDRTLRVWELATGQECALLERASEALDAHILGASYQLAFSPDGALLAAAGQSGDRRRRIDLWDIRGGRRLTTLDGHRGAVTALAFAPDGRRLISGGMDTEALVWEVPPRPRVPAAAPDDGRTAALWADLGDADAAKAYRAVGAWLAAPEAAVAVFRRLRRPTEKLDAERVNRLIADLDSEEFAVREQASQQLKALGSDCHKLLRRALAKSTSAEVTSRIKEVLAGSPDEDLRGGRAVEVLEALGTPPARALLQEWAKGDPANELARDAGAALSRMRRH